MDSGTDSVSNSKPDSYIVLCRTCSHKPRTRIPTPSFCVGEKSESVSISESVSSNVNDPLPGPDEFVALRHPLPAMNRLERLGEVQRQALGAFRPVVVELDPRRARYRHGDVRVKLTPRAPVKETRLEDGQSVKRTN